MEDENKEIFKGEDLIEEVCLTPEMEEELTNGKGDEE